MRIVKTWYENTKEGCSYLKYNNYGKIVVKLHGDYYLCIGKQKPDYCKDVEMVFNM